MREEITLQLHQETIKNLLIFYENDDARGRDVKAESISYTASPNITMIQVMRCYQSKTESLKVKSTGVLFIVK